MDYLNTDEHPDYQERDCWDRIATAAMWLLLGLVVTGGAALAGFLALRLF